jgi:hypothetical protein
VFDDGRRRLAHSRRSPRPSPVLKLSITGGTLHAAERTPAGDVSRRRRLQTALVRSLKAGAAGLYIVGCNDDRFTLKQSSSDSLYLLPPVTAAEFESVLLRLMDR